YEYNAYMCIGVSLEDENLKRLRVRVGREGTMSENEASYTSRVGSAWWRCATVSWGIIWTSHQQHPVQKPSHGTRWSEAMIV
ncbi:hypothetical protein HAX54_016471, partial [Datura stramonium]|nr:hypothetical protein [Datura stramonium]